MPSYPFPPCGPANEPPPRRPDPLAPGPVGLVWIGGVALAVLAYVIGPDHVVAVALQAIEQAVWYLADLPRNLGHAVFAAMRAAAIGLLGVFVALSLLIIKRSGRGHGGLIALTAAFVLIVWGANDGEMGFSTRWLLALALAAAGAVGATNRLMHPSPGGWRIPGRPPR